MTLQPPFTIYHTGTEIADANGHVCTAEDPEIAKELVAALNAYFRISGPKMAISSTIRTETHT